MVDAPEETRRDPRRAVRTEFRLGDDWGLGEIHLDSHDLSSGGAFLQADLLYEIDEVISLEFEIPGTAQTIRTRGRVAWVNRTDSAGNPPGMGIQFLDLSDGDRAALGAFAVLDAES